MEILAVAKDGVHVYSFVPGEKLPESPMKTFPGVKTADSVAWSKDGSLLGILDPSTGGVNIHDPAAEYAPLSSTKALVGGPVRSFYFSPRGTYLVTWERHVKDGGKAEGNNVGVWNSKTGELAWSFILKTQTATSWPCLKWSADESICCRMVQDEIVILDGKKLNTTGEEARRLAAPKVTGFEVSPGAEPAIAVLIPEVKGAPAKCLLYKVDNLRAPAASKSFYKAEEVKMMWNSSGSAILVLTSTAVDDSGQNYYGSNHLYFMRLDGQEDTTISSPDDGVVHAVSWSPTQNEFIVLNGKLPCNMAMYDGQKALERLNFGKGHRNTINWNPHGRFVSLGGFGNLLGDVDFWDKPGKKVMGSVRMECCVVSEWSPDGRHFLAATTSPRMRVDNNIRIYDYVGQLLHTKPFEELLLASWRPRPRAAFQDRAASPGRQGAVAKAKAPEPKKQAYRPPGARGGGGYAGGFGGGLAAQLRSELGSTSAGPQTGTATKVTGKAAAPMNIVPGMAPPGASDQGSGASRNARKKKAKEAKEASEETARSSALEAALAPSTFELPTAPQKAKASEEAPAPAEGDADVEKKVRNLRKKLREIEKIKEKDGPLDPLQKQKIAGEADLIKQIRDLGAEP
eukprot:gnl/MRDRNA2_/MRDRNA2_131590_c0_seq1.p1 gnl/MRDRNA2_/MRDRNA2_131590_c0~~gnl/MRDRNA2_/MRDRNA2_131590_c0_seq1.p1  ORF type:complete len:627 (+),score=155.00 gnl/MRDRNA2_/MRDRNA2_131590_c0_seq1:100-1980(+)